MIAAPLKRILIGQRRVDRDAFRDHMIAAPLKQTIRIDLLPNCQTFRDQLIAAPLKRGTAHRSRRTSVDFPRSIDRGSIEA